MAKRNVAIIIYIILKTYTDENNCLTRDQIQDILNNEYNCSIERKTFYCAIADLQGVYLNVNKIRKCNTWYYYYQHDTFTTAEARFLLDLINNNSNLNVEQYYELSGKILATQSELFKDIVGNDLRCDVVYHQLPISLKVVDQLYEAINNKCKIKFNYIFLNYLKQKEIKERTYCVSPYYLVFNQNHYYLIASYENHKNLAYVRVDHITNVEILTEMQRPIKEVAENFALDKHLFESPIMYGGQKRLIHLEVNKKQAGLLLDFYPLARLIKEKENTAIYETNAVINNTFYGWLLQSRDCIDLVYPEEILTTYKTYLKEAWEKLK